jgi:hypothetical protein
MPAKLVNAFLLVDCHKPRIGLIPVLETRMITCRIMPAYIANEVEPCLS